MDNPQADIRPGELDMQRVGMTHEMNIDQGSVEKRWLFKQVVVIVGDVAQARRQIRSSKHLLRCWKRVKMRRRTVLTSRAFLLAEQTLS